jgi:hypothetical protein
MSVRKGLTEEENDVGQTPAISRIHDNSHRGRAVLGGVRGGAPGHNPVAALLAPDSDTPRMVTARVYDSCTGADQNFTFTSFQLNVIGAS